MAFRLIRFGATEIPHYNGDHDLSTGRARLPSTDLATGGSYDLLGTLDAPLDAPSLTARGFLIGNAEQLRTQLMALRARAGQRDKLWRQWDSGELEWTWARIEQEPVKRSRQNVGHIEPSITFRPYEAVWYGDVHGATYKFGTGLKFGTGYVFGASGDTIFTLAALSGTAQPLTLPYAGGNGVVKNAILKLKAGTAAIEQFTIKVNQAKWTWIAPMLGISPRKIEPGETLVVNTGNWDFAIGSTSVLAGLQPFTSEHKIPALLYLSRDATTLEISGSGGGTGSTLAVEYVEAHL